ncbi:HD domain-containing protein [Amycolatopsis carbonis]|uniref:HD domain-containing protein n=1 Tax=Amycolatopsis carbonis TaxID=715471 RepID=A0A9Y2IN55_9PSEU|nr:HD domain-containing protein [Amycolatopsis sp. 2-15]WIX81678.1 HD domain-containing protein [Amycolatopsis sp. 2-15]
MLPQAPTAGAALGVATRFFSPTLLNHSIRCYLWGAMYGAAHEIAFDDELFYVSALLHDIGLTEAFDNHWRPFEEAGGNLAWVFGVAAGWPAEQADRAAEIIVLHMGDDVSRDADPEAHLLQIATSFEVTGRWAEEFPPDARTEVLARYPRLGFSAELLAEFEDQARRKPSSACATSIGKNLAERMTGHPLDNQSSA